MANRNSRTLVFSFDGTGNEPADANEFKENESVSNVLKLHILMGGGFQKDNSSTKTPQGNSQITYYYNGIGTHEEGRSIPLLGQIISMVNMAFAPRFGDAQRILDEAKKDFKKTYEPDDTVVIFGFSRGAALARKFASRILDENQECEVSFLGVFDTVAAMDGIHRKGERISSDVVFENGTLNNRITRAVHLVSLDEDRVPFTPTLINKDHDNPNRILEVWFPGVHSDIGGGYWFDGLSDVALQFMIEECKNKLGDSIQIYSGNDGETISGLLQEQESELSMLEIDDIVINPIVNGVVHRHSGLLTGEQEPRAICVNDNDRPSKGDVPILHHSVKDRFKDVPNYRPQALRGCKFKILLDDGNFSDMKSGVSGLRNLVNS